MKIMPRSVWVAVALGGALLLFTLAFLLASYSAGVPPSEAIKIMRVERGRLTVKKIVPGKPFNPQKLDGRTVEVVGVVDKGVTISGVYACLLRDLENVKIIVFPDTRDYLKGKGVPLGHLQRRKVWIKGIFQVHEKYGYEIIVEDMKVLENNNITGGD